MDDFLIDQLGCDLTQIATFGNRNLHALLAYKHRRQDYKKPQCQQDHYKYHRHKEIIVVLQLREKLNELLFFLIFHLFSK